MRPYLFPAACEGWSSGLQGWRHLARTRRPQWHAPASSLPVREGRSLAGHNPTQPGVTRSGKQARAIEWRVCRRRMATLFNRFQRSV